MEEYEVPLDNIQNVPDQARLDEDINPLNNNEVVVVEDENLIN